MPKDTIGSKIALTKKNPSNFEQYKNCLATFCFPEKLFRVLKINVNA